MRKHKKTHQKKRKTLRMIMSTLGLAAAAGLLAYLFFFGSWRQYTMIPDKIDSTVRIRTPLSVDPNAGELITPSPAPTEPGVAIDGWSRITVPANSLEAAVSLHNPEDNAGWYYLTYELRLKRPENAPEDEPEEVIFTTGLIPPGLYCNKVTLTRKLEKGVYPAILHVQPYRMNEEMSPTNNADLELLLVVE